MEYKNADTKKIIYIAAIIISLILSCISYYLGTTYQNIKRIEITENPAIGYRVDLEENAYFKDNATTQRYITSMIKGIDIDFDYLSKQAKQKESKYKYIVETELIITDKNDTTHKLWSKTEKLTEKENVSKEDVKFSDTVKIDYQNYNNLVKSFNETYGLQTSATLYVKCKVNVDSNYDSAKKPVSYQNEMVVKIPLNETTILITTNVQNTNTRVVESIAEGPQIIQYLYYLMAFIFFLSTIYFVTKRVELFYQQYKTETEYEKTLRKILRNYDDIIVTTQNKPYIKTKEIVKVASFEELLDAQAELREPIIFYEKNGEANFIITQETRSYKYVLKKEDSPKNDETI